LRSVHPANGRLMTVKPKITVADHPSEYHPPSPQNQEHAAAAAR
jgi:hypothetical protein